jgi:hypothetical protein
MAEILLSQPATCLFPVFVLTMLFWALWTRDVPSGRPGKHPELRRRPDGVRLSPPAVGRFPSAYDKLHASCTADYNVHFDMMCRRVRRPGV